ncbi:MAG: Eco57I restriction-modification methylase domain-containing protein [Bryobacterales bacterium]|nr:Eco57I restriction-modification methylase domain-containing protein [Bryobacterales bacterium]MDE0295901.1 Eco57I restriction-modification methylase domain-containing protein [Bryobacterales bacterium]
MPVSMEELRPRLRDFDFTGLFVEGLGWNHYPAEPLAVLVDGREYSLKPVAEKAGFAVYECAPDQDGAVPPYPVRRKIESQVAKSAFEHMVVFADEERTTQVWQWVKREAGKPAACREQQFHAGQGGDPLLQRLREIAFTLDEEQGLDITKVASKVSKSLDVEKVTKRFYERFKTELTCFGNFIDGITAQGDRDWYASLMLNRMMFVYFIQKQGFLDRDHDYLRNRLRMVRDRSGGGRFQQFYRIFLLRLFHEGLGQPEAQRAPDLAALLGEVPFLNGGLFDVHDLERDNPDISIPDEAFERVFDFFDGYRWHLDERPYREDNEINPDVLGYIFEKYVNQKQMGAYYTKEDITGYISRNTVVPFLFDAARKACSVAFGPDGGVWRLLRDDPDRYIYPAVGHGIVWNARQAEDPKPLDGPFDLPDEVAAGIEDVSKRAGWNRLAPDDYALPTETWREVVARRRRYDEVRAKLASGEVQEINDLITLNLDVERFARDVITQSEGPELLSAFWRAMYGISVLDPTCGSGAFLFAALNLLEPLYTSCLEGMQGFLDDLERTDRPHHPDALRNFRKVLERVKRHPSKRYFILKSIVLNNLYGVDIMEEAVEICKLRLFLKLVAQLETYDQIEPLPDIDFNIRAGNTLVGFTSLDAVRQAMTITPGGQYRDLFEEDRDALKRIEEEADIASSAFKQFRDQQTELGGEVTADDKADLRRLLLSLSDELDRCLATEYGVELGDTDAYYTWRTGHQPFHWFAEFYGIMHKGGFDVVIGNPPYVEYRKVQNFYTIKGYATAPCGNLYAYVVERNAHLTSKAGRTGMIVPHSSICTDRMALLQVQMHRARSTWISTYDIRPAKLFSGVDQRLAIYMLFLGRAKGHVFSSRYYRWHETFRPYLLQSIEYVGSKPISFPNSVPKVHRLKEISLLEKLLPSPLLRSELRTSRGGTTVYYHNAPRYWVRAMDFAPYFWNERDGEQISSHVKTLALASLDDRAAVIASLNSSLFYWWFLLLSNCRDLTLREIEKFPLGLNGMSRDVKRRLAKLTTMLMTSFKLNSYRKETRYKTTGKVIYDEFDLKPSKPIVDKIDCVLAEHYGFTDEELDFIINYDIKYRMRSDK